MRRTAERRKANHSRRSYATHIAHSSCPARCGSNDRWGFTRLRSVTGWARHGGLTEPLEGYRRVNRGLQDRRSQPLVHELPLRARRLPQLEDPELPASLRPPGTAVTPAGPFLAPRVQHKTCADRVGLLMVDAVITTHEPPSPTPYSALKRPLGALTRPRWRGCPVKLISTSVIGRGDDDLALRGFARRARLRSRRAIPAEHTSLCVFCPSPL